MTELVVCIAVFGAGFVQGALGFGFGLVSMSLLPLVMGVRESVLLVAIFAFAMNGGLLWHLRAHVNRRGALTLALGIPFGAPIGILLLLHASPELLLLALGVLVIGYAVRELRGVARNEENPVPGPIWGVAAGFTGSVLGTAFNVGGPPAIVYGTACRWRPLAFKATLQAFFMLTAIVQVGMLTHQGVFTAEQLQLNALGAPALLAGAWTGLRVSRRLDHDRFRRIVLLALLLLGLSLLARAAG